MPRKALRVDACATDPTLDVRSVGVSPALAAALLGRAGEALDVIEALLATHPVLLVRERPTSPRHVVALRPVIREAVSLHPSRLLHLVDDDGEVQPLLVVMPLRDEARAALLARVDHDVPLSNRRGEAVAALGAEASLCLDDLAAPPEKRAIVAEAERRAAAVHDRYLEGVLLDRERHRSLIYLWADASNNIGRTLSERVGPHGRLRALRQAGVVSPHHALILVGMRGVCARPDGSYCELPIRRSLAEGYTSHEFFVTATEARRQLAEAQAREARSDALLRRLVRRLGKVRVTEEDCGAVEGIRIRRVAYHYAGAPFKRLLRGRVLVADVVDPYSSQVLARAGIPLDDAAATSLVSWPDEVEVRSPATCRARDGVCRLCMGPLDTRERHAGLAVALRVAHVARFMTRRAFHVGC
jgi:hypothetical protein